MLRKSIKNEKGSLTVNESYVGETIEQKVERITTNKEPIEDTAPTIYTERKEGVLPQYNPRTDRFDVALDAMDKVHKSNQAKSMELYKNNISNDDKNNTNDSEAKPIQASSNE